VKAAVLEAIGAPLRVQELTLEAPRAGEVLVRVEAAGVCHSDYHYMTGDLRCPLPVVVGHEGAGVVEAVGSDVASVGPGDRVAMLWRPRCGRCAYCVAGQPVMCELGRVQATTGGLPDDGTTRLRRGGHEVHHLMGVSCFAERAVVSEKSVVKITEGVPSEIAAITGCAVITGVGAVLNVVGECAGRPLLVLGAGGVGLSAVMGARLVGAEPVIVVDVEPARLELAQRLGATCVIQGGAGAVDAVLAVAPDGVDWAIEAVGRAETLQQAIACLRPGGTAVAVGLGRAGATFEVPINELVQRQKRVVGSLYGSANPLLDLPRLWRLYLAGRLPLDTLLGERYPLDAVNEAYTALIAGAVGRAAVVP
jgi:S-(hydroxymethyl)glutathione dehydrogenase/alcohol dehydrogenase